MLERERERERERRGGLTLCCHHQNDPAFGQVAESTFSSRLASGSSTLPPNSAVTGYTTVEVLVILVCLFAEIAPAALL